LRHLSDDLDVSEAMAGLTTSQLMFAAARVNFSNDKETAESLNISPKTVYGWSRQTKKAIAVIQRAYLIDAITASKEVLNRYALRAALIKVEGLLGSNEDSTQQAAASEILDRVLGKPRQSVEVKGEAVAPKTYITVSPDMWDDAE